MDEDDEQLELIQEFLVESTEGLDQLDQDLVSLEDDPEDADTLQGIFRTFHTIKGTASFLGFDKLESLAHAAENLLAKLRDGTLTLNPERTSVLLRSVDTLRAMLESVSSTQQEGSIETEALVADLNRMMQSEAAGEPPVAQPSLPPGSVDADGKILVAPSPILAAPAAEEGEGPPPDAPTAAVPAPLPAASADTADPAAPGDADRRPKATTADGSIRVDVGLLDSLMNLVGELVLTRNQILQHSASEGNPGLSRSTQRLNLITSDLQEGVMKTRMQPIKNVWSKFPRVVRDLTQACGKRAAIRMEGAETELDRTILEAIRDPLTHMVRNSVDHGLETAEERNAAGKPAEGTLVLRAYHEGGQVNLEIADDGRGIDVEKVTAKALERGLVTRERIDRMSERELLQLIFLPGFSTAAQVTNVSGRGVGMDVVRTNIEKIGGTIDLQSTRGAGTTVRIKIPLTLAIIPALLVSANANRYAIPQVSLLELVRIEGRAARDAVEHVHGAPVFRLRGHLLPLVDLRSQLGAPPADEAEDPANASLNIVVLQADDRQYGLIVDEVSDTEEIVVKPLGRQLRDLPVFAGATIMGDGRVALILDAIGIAERAGFLGEHDGRDGGVSDEQPAQALHEGDALLLVQREDERKAAIPLSAVSRLEEVELERVERGGDHWVIQYRDRIMPLVTLSGAAPGDGIADDQKLLRVVVHSFGDAYVGLVVEQIEDIVQTHYEVEAGTGRHGILGSAVVQGRVTDLLDIEQVLRDALPQIASGGEGVAFAGAAR